MPHTDRCGECEVQLVFLREYEGVTKSDGEIHRLQEWRCDGCGRIYGQMAQSWPLWFYRTRAEEKRANSDLRWGRVPKIPEAVKEGRFHGADGILRSIMQDVQRRKGSGGGKVRSEDPVSGVPVRSKGRSAGKGRGDGTRRRR